MNAIELIREKRETALQTMQRAEVELLLYTQLLRELGALPDEEIPEPDPEVIPHQATEPDPIGPPVSPLKGRTRPAGRPVGRPDRVELVRACLADGPISHAQISAQTGIPMSSLTPIFKKNPEIFEKIDPSDIRSSYRLRAVATLTPFTPAPASPLPPPPPPGAVVTILRSQGPLSRDALIRALQPRTAATVDALIRQAKSEGLIRQQGEHPFDWEVVS
jgi:hypothetical protein